MTAVHAFGSWSRGAPTVGDLDLDITYDSTLDPEVHQEVVDRLVVGRDWNTPIRRALRPRRTLQLQFNRLEMIVNPVLLYQRGDMLAQACARINAIAIVPSEGRAPRDPVHPTIEPVAEDLARPSRILLTELVAHGYLETHVVDLPDADLRELDDNEFCLTVHTRWSPTSPLARAAIAGGAWLQAQGVPLARVKLLGHQIGDAPALWTIEAREHKLRRFFNDLRDEGIRDWLFVLAAARKRPLRGLHLTRADPNGLAAIESLDSWLAEHAPHMRRIG
ncbi:MAG TPA: hypothetical protein VGG41_11905 [Solirubrobacteraceae bacterium]